MNRTNGSGFGSHDQNGAATAGTSGLLFLLCLMLLVASGCGKSGSTAGVGKKDAEDPLQQMRYSALHMDYEQAATIPML